MTRTSRRAAAPDIGSRQSPVGDVVTILIGGTSHVGKSTLARALGERLGWRHVSTDLLARHPGRPWETTKADVVDYFLQGTAEALTDDVLVHYRRLLPRIRMLVNAPSDGSAEGGLIVEGSAIWPSSFADLPSDRAAALWLTAEPSTLTSRIIAGSKFEQAGGRKKASIQSFIQRTIRFDELMMQAIRELDLPCINIEAARSTDELVRLTLAAVAS